MRRTDREISDPASVENVILACCPCRLVFSHPEGLSRVPPPMPKFVRQTL
jgi:hypothetical protein